MKVPDLRESWDPLHEKPLKAAGALLTVRSRTFALTVSPRWIRVAPRRRGKGSRGRSCPGGAFGPEGKVWGMLTSGAKCCSECSTPMLDVGDELVCPRCGVVEEKIVVEVPPGDGPSKVPATGRQPLGSFMGTYSITNRERFSRGLSASSSRYEYMKAVSDGAGKEDGSLSDCVKLMERVAEKLYLPRIIIVQAASVAKKVFEAPRPRRRVTVAAVSAYSLIVSCKIEEATSVSLRELVAAHSALGMHVTHSSIIQISLDSPIRTFARRPEDYLQRVLAKLSLSGALRARLDHERVALEPYLASLRETAGELLVLVGEGPTAGRRPCALAASAIYSAELVLCACEGRKKRTTQRAVAGCGDTAEYTLREQCAEIFASAVKELAARRKQPLLLEAAA
jgi:transcription initiation factor TFIIIB Brf1 subunit/transcription initiation factor TFIIB